MKNGWYVMLLQVFFLIWHLLFRTKYGNQFGTISPNKYKAKIGKTNTQLY